SSRTSGTMATATRMTPESTAGQGLPAPSPGAARLYPRATTGLSHGNPIAGAANPGVGSGSWLAFRVAQLRTSKECLPTNEPWHYACSTHERPGACRRSLAGVDDEKARFGAHPRSDPRGTRTTLERLTETGMQKNKGWRQIVKGGAISVALTAIAAAAAPGCLDYPIAPLEPRTTTTIV